MEDEVILQEELNNRLSKNGWAWCLISILEDGFRIQLSDDGEEETGWRKCVEASTLKEAIDEAEKLVNSVNAYEYGKGQGFNSPQSSPDKEVE